jgi:hypothetical protein
MLAWPASRRMLMTRLRMVAMTCGPVPVRAVERSSLIQRHAVAAVVAVISYRHAYELVSTHGETGLTARLIPFTSTG